MPVVRHSGRGRVLCCAVWANPLPLPGGRLRPRHPPNTTSESTNRRERLHDLLVPWPGEATTGELTPTEGVHSCRPTAARCDQQGGGRLRPTPVLFTVGISAFAREHLRVVEREPERPLSPELVLVSPELRERALLEEGDAPFPPQADVDPPTASVAPEPQVPLPSPPAVPRRAETTAGPVERRLTVGAATAIALTALIVFGAGVAVGKLAFPTSTARSPAAPRAASPPPSVTAAVPRTSSSASATLPATSTARSQAAPRTAFRRPPVTTAVPRTASSASTTLPAQQPRSSTAPARAKRLPSRTVRPIPNGGYVLSDGRFRLSGTGRRILDFTLRTTCSGPLTLPPIQVAASGTFTFSGKPPGALPGTTVRVTGRFVSPDAASGTTRVTRGTCRSPARPFAAHLS